ncbi:hypothetical protein [Streptomyces echinatus]|uniref:hypothetical protein n=1 Tax=Streptomyces echinatus TaxID=67293 RepID=UPI0031EC1836
MFLTRRAPHRRRRLSALPLAEDSRHSRTRPAARAGTLSGTAPVQYVDYTLWQQRLLGDSDTTGQTSTDGS